MKSIFNATPGIIAEGTNLLKSSNITLYGFFEAYNHQISLISLMMLTSTLVIFYLKSIRYRQEKALEAYLAESRISKKLHDEVANEIYSTISQLEKQETIAGHDKEKLIQSLSSIYHSTRNISRETASINTGSQYLPQFKDMVGKYSCSSTNIIIKGMDSIHWKTVSDLKKIMLYRAVQELMTNMKKHSRASVIILDFKALDNKLFACYKDNGLGITKTEFVKNGLQNVENRIESIGGNVIFETRSGKGFHLTISFPLNSAYV